MVAGSTKRGSNSLTNTLSELDEILKDDSLLFHQRLNFIKKQINEEIKPNIVVSRDHGRTNKNGVSLERLEQMKTKGLIYDPAMGSPQADQNPFRKEHRASEFADHVRVMARGSTPKAENSNHHLFGSATKAIGNRKMTQLQQSAREIRHLNGSGPSREDVLAAAL